MMNSGASEGGRFLDVDSLREIFPKQKRHNMGPSQRAHILRKALDIGEIEEFKSFETLHAPLRSKKRGRPLKKKEDSRRDRLKPMPTNDFSHSKTTKHGNPKSPKGRKGNVQETVRELEEEAAKTTLHQHKGNERLENLEKTSHEVKDSRRVHLSKSLTVKEKRATRSQRHRETISSAAGYDMSKSMGSLPVNSSLSTKKNPLEKLQLKTQVARKKAVAAVREAQRLEEILAREETRRSGEDKVAGFQIQSCDEEGAPPRSPVLWDPKAVAARAPVKELLMVARAIGVKIELAETAWWAMHTYETQAFHKEITELFTSMGMGKRPMNQVLCNTDPRRPSGWGDRVPNRLLVTVLESRTSFSPLQIKKILALCDPYVEGTVSADRLIKVLRARERPRFMARHILQGKRAAIQQNAVSEKGRPKSRSAKTSRSAKPSLRLSEDEDARRLNSKAGQVWSTRSLLELAFQRREHVRELEKQELDWGDPMDNHRDTPRVLRPGGLDAKYAELKRELDQTSHVLGEIQKQLRKDVERSTQEMAWGAYVNDTNEKKEFDTPMTSARSSFSHSHRAFGDGAKSLCQKLAKDKFQKLWGDIKISMLQASIVRWGHFVQLRNKELFSEEFLRVYSGRKAAFVLHRALLRKQDRYLDSWRAWCRSEAEFEHICATAEVQRLVRGYLGRCKAYHRRRWVSALAIQRVYRGSVGRKLAADRQWEVTCARCAAIIGQAWKDHRVYRTAVRILIGLREQKASTNIQRAWRGHMGRREFDRALACHLREIAAVLIQKTFRGFQGRQLAAERQRRRTAAIKIQTKVRQRQAQQRFEELRTQTAAAIRIQTRARVFLAKNEAWRVRNAPYAIAIQRHCRGYMGRKRAVRRKQFLEDLQRNRAFAATTIQKVWRRYYVCYVLGFEFHAYRIKFYAAVKIQAAYRARLGRKRAFRRKRKLALRRRHKAAVKIQKVYRGYHLRESMREERLRHQMETRQRKIAARNIQRVWRGYRGRIYAKDYREIRIAQGWKAGKYGKYYDLKELYERQRDKMVGQEVVVTQSFARMAIAKTVARRMKLKIQRQLLEQKMALKLQCFVRVQQAIKLADSKRDEETRVRIKLERERKRQNNAATKLQSAYRNQSQRKKYAQIIWSIVMVQKYARRWKAWKALEYRKKEHQAELLAWAQQRREEAAVIKIQAFWRGRKARNKFKYALEKRREQLRIKRDESALIIQCAYRIWLAKKLVATKRLHAEEKREEEDIERLVEERLPEYHRNQQKELQVTRIQSHFRRKRANAKFVALKIAADRKEEDMKNRKEAEAATKIQTFYRCVMSKHWYNTNYEYLVAERERARRCVECEVKYATRLCHICEDKYCESCWGVIHAKGNKQYHTYESAYSEFYQYHNDGNDENHYTEEYGGTGAYQSPEQYHGDYSGFDATGQYGSTADFTASAKFSDFNGNEEYPNQTSTMETKSSWTQHFDSNAGSAYWYNSVTGEASWIDPDAQ